MKLLKLKEVSFDRKQDHIFKESFWRLFIMTMLFGCLLVLCLIGLLSKFLQPVFLIAFLTLLFMTSICLRSLLKTRRDTNWLLVLRPEGLLIKFRSYANCHFKDCSSQVISISFDEIAAVRIVKEKMWVFRDIFPGNSRRSILFKTYLDVVLSGFSGEEIKKSLSLERNIRERTLYHGYPVTMPTDQIIRLEWRSERTRVIPGIKCAVALFSKHHIRVEDQINLKHDYTNFKAWDKEQLDHEINDLIERGYVIYAQILVQKALGLNASQSHKLIEEFRKG